MFLKLLFSLIYWRPKANYRCLVPTKVAIKPCSPKKLNFNFVNQSQVNMSCETKYEKVIGEKKKLKKILWAQKSCKMCFNVFINISGTPEPHFWETIFPCGLRSWREAKVSEWALWDMKQENDEVSNPATTWSHKNHQSTEQMCLRAVPAAQPASPGWWTLPILIFISQCLCNILWKRCERKLKVPERGEWPLLLE